MRIKELLSLEAAKVKHFSIQQIGVIEQTEYERNVSSPLSLDGKALKEMSSVNL